MLSRRTFTVTRDRWLEGLGREELSLFADELSDAELIALPEPMRSEALREIRCVLQHGGRGREVVAAPRFRVRVLRRLPRVAKVAARGARVVRIQTAAPAALEAA